MHLLTARRITACLAAASLIAVLAGCSAAADPGTQPAPPTNPTTAATTPAQEPQTVEAARALLDKALGRAVAGDHAGTWDLYIPEDRALIGRDEYVAYQNACNASGFQGAPYEIADVRLEGPDVAVGIAKVGRLEGNRPTRMLPMTETDRHPPTGRLMGLQEIEKRLGVSRQRVHQLTQHPSFPAAYDTIKAGRIWRTEDIDAWIQAREERLSQGEGAK